MKKRFPFINEWIEKNDKNLVKVQPQEDRRATFLWEIKNKQKNCCPRLEKKLPPFLPITTGG